MSDDEKKVSRGYHCVWQIHYHIVFPLKYRKALLDDEVTNIIVETAEEIQKRYAIEMEAIGCDKNHIHLLCSAHPKVAPGRIVQIFKSVTAREVFRRKPSVKNDLWGGEFWTDGYFVGTIGEHANWDIVERYVRRQSMDSKGKMDDKATDDLRQLKLFAF
ncbi:MAG: IS200/IS605 family transposase [Deltaproteobacteria bacterium]|nr:IS200/IS605 family transposase [Deltaproteobacteria bacterium]MBF0528368.1 IS200/IS605 family transposase [Deltaproteobacteria bacterium]